ncbi:MAG: rRNA maturation RNase YbeY [Pseudomonadota bacterium]
MAMPTEMPIVQASKNQCLEIDAAIDEAILADFDEQTQVLWLQAIAAVAQALSTYLSVTTDQQPGVIGSKLQASVLVSSNERVRELNAAYRGQDKPTNVLSFPSPDEFPFNGTPGNADIGQCEVEPRHIGDCILARDVLKKEAAEHDKPVVHHLQHLVVHGILHLMGYDHETSDADAEEMEALETAILSGLGIANPYEDSHAVRVRLE